MSAEQDSKQQEERAKSAAAQRMREALAARLRQAGSIHVENQAGVVMSFTVSDGARSVSSGNYFLNQSRSVDLSDFPEYSTLRLTVHVVAGVSQEAPEHFAYFPGQPPVTYRVTGAVSFVNTKML